MIILAMDTAQGACSSAVTKGGDVLAARYEPMRTGHAERLMPQVLEVLAEAGLTPRDVTRLASTIGPGTFTGTRVALSAARGMALVLGVPLIGVTTLEAVAAAITPAKGTVRVAAFDAKRGEVYLQVFESEELAPLTEPLCLAVEETAGVIAKAAGGRGVILAGTGAELLAAHLPEAEIAPVEPHPQAAQVALIAGSREPQEGPVSPLYLRAPDAKLPEPK